MKPTLLALLLFAAAPLAAQAPDYAALAEIYLDPSIGKLDYDTHTAKLVAVCEKNPASEEAVLALLSLHKTDKWQTSPQPVFQMLKKLAKDDFRACGKFAPAFVRSYLHWAKRIETDDTPNAVARRFNGVTQVAVCGPFAEPGSPAHDDVFAPEVRLDLERAYSGAYGPIRFRKLDHHDENDDELDLYGGERHHGAGYYVVTNLNVPRAAVAWISVDFTGPGKIWLRGVQLLDQDTRARECARGYMAVKLAQGDNPLMVKISSISNLRIRVRGDDGRPIEGLKASVPAGGPYPIQRNAPAIAELRPLWAEKFEKALEALRTTPGPSADKPRQMALCHLALSALCGQFGLRTEAALQLEEARYQMGEAEGVALAFVRELDENPLYSPSATRRARRAALNELVAAGKGLAAAHLELATSFARDERTPEVAEHSRKALEASAAAWPVWIELAEYYRQLQWRAEWFGALQRAQEIAPTAPAVLSALARYHSAGNAVKLELDCWQRLQKVMPNDRDVRLSIVSLLLRLGRGDEAYQQAEAHMLSDPGDVFARQRLAEVCFATGRLELGLKFCDELAAKVVEPERYYNLAAKALVSAGDSKRAERYFERALAADPSENHARRMLWRLKGESGEFWKDHALTFEQAKKLEPAGAGDGRAQSALVLDEMVQQVFADGSSISYVHQVRKILTQDGVDARGKDRILGTELVMARTIKADGTVLEPVTFAGNQIEYPGVEIGCYLEMAYLQFNGPSPYRALYNDRFYFEDQSFREPFYISRWVLMTPPEMRLNIRRHNFTDGPDVTVRHFNKGEHAVRIWDVRTRRHVEQEPFMPTPLEVIPWVELYQVYAWQRKARAAAETGLRRQRVTPLVKRLADEITGGNAAGLSDEQKARAIYGWVNARFLTAGDTSGAHQALKALAGSRDEVFLSLCKAAGVKLGFAFADAAPGQRSAREERTLMPDWVGPALVDFTTFLAVVRGDDGRRIYINFDERLRPFGACGTRLDGAPAIVWEDGRYEQTFLPSGAPDRDRYATLTEITLEADGSASVTGTLELLGERSYGLKERLRTVSQDQLRQELEREISSQFAGFEADTMEFPDLAATGKPLTRKYIGRAPALARKSGNALVLMLPAEKMAQLLSVLAQRDKRKQDIMLDFDLHQEDEIRITAPEGYTFGELPADSLFPCAPFLYSLTYKLEGRVLTVKRKVALGPGRITAAGYQGLLGQLARVRAAEDVRLSVVPADADAAKPEDVVPK